MRKRFFGVTKAKRHPELVSGAYKSMRAFTLAEVLITLGIIGVIAAMTIPSLIQNYQKKQYATVAKKAYTELSSVITDWSREEGCLGNLNSCPIWNLQNYSRMEQSFLSVFNDKLKVVKTCDETTGCMSSSYANLNNTGNTSINASDRSSVVTASGYAVGVWVWFKGCNAEVSNAPTSAYTDICTTSFYIDVNGIKGPNKWGRDMFQLTLNNKGVILPWNIWNEKNTTYTLALQIPSQMEARV